MRNDKSNETALENEMEQVLVDSGYARGNNSEYSKDKALFCDDVIAFIQNTQPKLWQRVLNGVGDTDKARERIISDLTRDLNDNNKGCLSVLRHGFKCYGKIIKMAYFQPNSQINDDDITRYQQNIVKVTRQVTTENGERPDMVLSINGIPVVTIELKNEMSATGWTVENAKTQFMHERNSNGNLYRFKTRTLVHFGVDTSECVMTTRLAGDNTFFLPFNRGNNEGAGNPDGDGEVKTAYLFRDVLAKDSLMDIVKRFIHLKKESKKVKTPNGYTEKTTETMIFPRFHQLDVVRKLISHSKENGSGHNYLIQHSAGSGKSNSIAWLAHQLSVLHNSDNEKIFNSVIVITDRLVLDKQLQETIVQFEHTDGVVKEINKHSSQLAKAIASDKQIIITTIQKFPFVLSSIERLREKGDNISLNTKDKRFAIIVDEAHSSQTGETAAELRKLLNKDDIESAIAQEFLNDNSDAIDTETGEIADDICTEMQIEKEAKKRTRQANLSYFAFTATPKWKTMAIFDEKGDNGEPPFHKYTMRQAIEEGFILDVLQNYTTYEQYFKILKTSQEDKELSKNKGKKELLRFVNMHPSVIEQKVEIIVEHFKNVTIHKIGGRAKAMVVTSSRESAVRYKLAFDKYIQEKNYTDIKSLVAFSGSLALSDAPEKEYTEVSLNNGISEKTLPEHFATDDYQVLLVADKYQTGFDQPLLHTMFVDKHLSDVQAVQTLSRLNRTHKGKTDTFVLDFVNSRDDMMNSFRDYYTTTKLGEIPDSDKLEQLANQLDNWQLYFESDIDKFSAIWFSDTHSKITNNQHGKLNAIIDKVITQFNNIDASDDNQREEKQRQFKSDVQSYLNLYLFVSQIVDYTDTSHEKRYVFLHSLLAKLPKANQESKVDLSSDIVLQYYRLQKKGEGAISLKNETSKGLKGSTDVGTGRPKTTDELSHLIEELNDSYGTDFTVADQLFFDQIVEEALNDEQIRQSAKTNSLEDFSQFLLTRLLDLLLSRIDGNVEICNIVAKDESVKEKVNKRLAKNIYKKVQNGA